MSKRGENPENLNDQQERFAHEYLIDLNATLAAERAGYKKKAAASQGSRLLKNAKVKKRIKELLNQRNKRAEIAADDVLKELSKIGFNDMRAIFDDAGNVKPMTEWPEDVARACASITVEEIREYENGQQVFKGYLKKVKFWDKPRSLELLGKNQGLFPNKVEHNGTLKLEDIVAGQGGEKKK